VLQFIRLILKNLRRNPLRTGLVASSLALAARVAQEKLAIPLVTVHLQPTAFRSAYEAPVFLRLVVFPRFTAGAR
jgi:hypothetical protein